MKVLLDECAPKYLKRALTEHEVQTVQEAGWSGLKNGELLALAQEHFEVFVTADKNLRYQQNLKERNIPIVELPTNTLSVVKKLVGTVNQILAEIRKGDYVQVEMPE
jgi:predicted nuclease of predicted toxin-antitoxin system